MRKGVGLLFLLLLLATPALAARPARVDVDELEVRDGPGAKFGVIEKLKRNDPVAASNVPIEGYFKIRTSTGIVGWVPADVLLIADPNEPRAKVQPISGNGLDEETRPKAVSIEPTAAELARRPGDSKREYVKIRLPGGYGLFDFGDVNGLLGRGIIQNGFNFGLEIDFLLPANLSAILRVDYVFHRSFGRDTDTLTNFQWDAYSFPAQVGLEYEFFQRGRFAIAAAVMGGVGISTTFSSTALNQAAPNVTSYNATAVAGTGRVSVDFQILKWFSLMAEVGYRYLRTGSTVAGTSGNGSDLLTTSGTLVPVSINLSGPYSNLALGFRF